MRVLLCLSASHKTAPFDLLERLSTPSEPLAPLITGDGSAVRGAIVLATCNRFEAYLDLDEPLTAAGAVGLEATLSAIAAGTGIAEADLDGAYEVHTGDHVARHLFSVAAGLESVVVGEGEIAGQVRRALVDARSTGTVSTDLERLFQRASEAQRGVKTHTALGRAGRSLVRLALDLADSRIADWSRQRVLLIGTGQYAAVTLATLRERGVTDITVYSPSGRAERFARSRGLAWADGERMPRVAASVDVIITCTNATSTVLDAAVLRAGAPAARGALRPVDAPGCPVAHGDRAERRLVIDLGMPRNVDPDVTEVAGVDLLDLETIRLHAPLEELQATEHARQIVGDAAERFARAGDAAEATPAVVALRELVLGLVDDEIARLPRVDGRADPRAEQALRHLAGRLLHTPSIRSHEYAAAGRADDVVAAMRVLYGIEPEHAAPVADADQATTA